MDRETAAVDLGKACKPCVFVHCAAGGGLSIQNTETGMRGLQYRQQRDATVVEEILGNFGPGLGTTNVSLCQ